MNHRVAVDAGRFVGRLGPREVMDRVRRHHAVALGAQNVDRRHVQQAGVLRAVRRVASEAPLTLHRGMLIDVRPALLHVALGANHVLIDSRSEVVRSESSVRVVAVTATHCTLVHLVVEGHGELRLDVVVALVAERGLRRLKKRLFLAAVNIVATDAADTGLGVRGTREVGVRAGMAAQALFIHFLGGGLGGIEDLGHVAAAGYVFASGAMAVLAGDAAGVAVHQGHPGVRVRSKSLGHLFVTGGAGV